MAAQEAEPLIPSQAALEEMRQHLAQEHDLGFEPKRDVSYAGNANPAASLTHRPESPAATEGFWCARCPGKVFAIAMAPKLSAERIDHLARHDEGLRQRLLDVGEGDRAELVEAHEVEKSGAALLARHRRRARQRTSKPQPAAQRRRDGAQAYLLAKYGEIGSVEEGLWDLLQLSTRDPKKYRQIMGTDRQFALETLRKYWQAIPLPKREAVKRRFREAQAKSG